MDGGKLLLKQSPRSSIARRYLSGAATCAGLPPVRKQIEESGWQLLDHVWL